jgi:hypothetical protein
MLQKKLWKGVKDDPEKQKQMMSIDHKHDGKLKDTLQEKRCVKKESQAKMFFEILKISRVCN